jgi:hypothetical protein
MIAELGKLKDGGLKIVIIEESIANIYKTCEKTEELAYAISGDAQMKIPQILTYSEQITKKFFDENILQNLIYKK